MKILDFENKLYALIQEHYTSPHQEGDIIIVLEQVGYYHGNTNIKKYRVYNLTRNLNIVCLDMYLREL